MKKYLSNISAFVILFLLTFLVSEFLFPATAFAQTTPPEPGFFSRLGSWFTGAWEGIASVAVDILLAPLGWVAILLLQLTNLFLFLAGQVLDMVIQFTVIDMRQRIEEATAINTAWTTMRDLANMTFIFILLYAAIQTILGIGTNTKKLIVNVVIVAILINFSLFFTKIVIDASNILAVFFYDAVATQDGISDRMLDELELKSLMNTGDIGLLDGKKMIIVGFFGSILVMIAAFIFFAAAMMFVVRFVILLLVLIFSPIAFASFALPSLRESIGKKWWNALIAQAFFAPIYLMITWIVITVSDSLFQPTNTTFAQVFVGVPNGPPIENQPVTAGNLTILMNFLIIGALLITSLIAAKSFANKAGSGASSLNKWALGAAGAATFGLAARAGRGVVGSRAAATLRNEELLKREARGDISARLQLATARKFSKSSFDIRGTKLGEQLGGGKVKTGGFAQEQKERAKDYEKYKPGPAVISAAKAREDMAKENLEKTRGLARQEAEKKVGKPTSLVEAEKQLKEAQDALAKPVDINTDPGERSRNETLVKTLQNQIKVEKEKYESSINQAVEVATQAERDAYKQAIDERDEIKNRMENIARRMEKKGLANFVTTLATGAGGKARADAVRAAAKGKSKKEKFAEAAEEYAKEQGIVAEKEEKPETPPESEGGSKTA